VPFRSAKQRKYLKRKEPKVYNRWKKKYGTKIKKKKKKKKKG
tara:strand:- start:46 stop:171 length:126 start_codon:yes stop_codon:yes gene_type:complete